MKAKTISISSGNAWSGIADCRGCKLRDSVLFSGLTEDDFQSLHRPIDQYSYKPGTVLYRTKEPGEYLYTLRYGLLKLVQYLPDGTQRIVRLVRATDLFGLEAVLNDCYRHDAIVLQQAELCRLPADVVNRLARENPDLHKELMNRWHRALTDADTWITELSTGSARQKVARLLLHLLKRNTDNKCYLFNREDMGAMLGITTETASRTIAEFRRQKLIYQVEGQQQLTCDTQRLKKITGG